MRSTLSRVNEWTVPALSGPVGQLVESEIGEPELDVESWKSTPG